MSPPKAIRCEYLWDFQPANLRISLRRYLVALNCGQEAVLNCSGSTVNSSKHSDGRILEDVLRGLGNSSPTCTGLGSGLIHPVTRACGHAQNPAEDSTAIRELTFRSTRRSPKTHLQTRFRERSSSILGSGHVQTLHSQRNEIHVRLIQHQGVGWAAGLLITARKLACFTISQCFGDLRQKQYLGRGTHFKPNGANRKN